MWVIESESRLVLRLLYYLFRLPFLLIFAIFNRSARKNLLEPIPELLSFLWQAKVTFTLATACFLVFVVLQNILLYTGTVSQDFLLSLLWKPEYLTRAHFTGSAIVPLFTHMFMHASILHLLGNMVFLFVFGRIVERIFGILGTIAIFLITGITATIVYSILQLLIFHNNGYLLGASGAISGLAATAILLEPFYITYILVVPLPILVLGWIQIISDVTGVLNPEPSNTVANLAHLAGFLAVTIVMYIFRRERKQMLRGLVINLATVAVVFSVLRLLL